MLKEVCKCVVKVNWNATSVRFEAELILTKLYIQNGSQRNPGAESPVTQQDKQSVYCHHSLCTPFFSHHKKKSISKPLSSGSCFEGS